MKQSIEIIKEMFCSILIVICIGLIIAIIFYDKISLNKVIPEADEYTLSNEMKKELEDSKVAVVEEVIVNYYIDATDLKKYENNNEYIKGKSDPFAESALIDFNVNGSVEGGSANDGSNGFYEDDGTK